MKQILKRAGAFFLSLCLTLSVWGALTPLSAAAETSGDYGYSVNSDGTATITEYLGSGGEVTIPGTLDGHTVTEIAYDAFYNCTEITTIIIPSSVTMIDSAWYGGTAFFGCTGLTSIVVDENNPNYSSKDGVLFNKNQTELLQYAIGRSGSYTIPDSVTTIGDNAFEICVGLTSVTIPDNVTEIGDYAFLDCTGLTSVTLPNSITEIGWGTFTDCTSLASIHIPDSVTAIGNEAFAYCTRLALVTIPDSVTTIGAMAFFNTGYYNNSANWENGVLYIGNHLIEAKEDELPAAYSIRPGTKTIADSAFWDCARLTSVDIPDSVTYIGMNAFEDCVELTSVIIGDSVTTIGASAFLGCARLTSIDIPNSVTVIGSFAFIDCTGLTSVIIPDNEILIGYDAFSGCKDLTIYGYAGSEAEHYAAENNIPFTALPQLSDDTTGIVVQGAEEAIPEGATLTAKQTASGEDTATYEITLTQNGQPIQPTGEVTVKIPLPESMRDKNIAVYRIEADGSRTDMNATVQNGYVVFVTDHFSQYLLEAKIMPADYTAVDAALAKVPEDLSGYTAETAQAVKDAVAAVERDLPITEQAKVDAMAKAIEDAVAALKKAEKPAVLGDIDGDGTVSVTDALAILRMAVGLSTPVDNADIDGMNGVTVTDALAALRIAVGLA